MEQHEKWRGHQLYRQPPTLSSLPPTVSVLDECFKPCSGQIGARRRENLAATARISTWQWSGSSFLCHQELIDGSMAEGQLWRLRHRVKTQSKTSAEFTSRLSFAASNRLLMLSNCWLVIMEFPELSFPSWPHVWQSQRSLTSMGIRTRDRALSRMSNARMVDAVVAFYFVVAFFDLGGHTGEDHPPQTVWFNIEPLWGPIKQVVHDEGGWKYVPVPSYLR